MTTDETAPKHMGHSSRLPAPQQRRKRSGPIRAAFLRFAMLCMSNKCNIAMRAACGRALRPLERAAAAVSLCVGEPFMTLAVPYAVVNVDVPFARVLLLAFSLTLYACNYVKNFLRVPRPNMTRQGPKLLVQEHGFGFPSSHSAIALAVPLAAAPFAAQAGLPDGVALAGALLIGFTIGVARLLLGVHSAADVLGGWAIGFAAGFFMVAVTSTGLLAWLAATPLLAVALVPASLALCVAHPPSRDMSAIQLDGGNTRDTTVEESVISAACWMGALVAGWRAVALPAMHVLPLAAVTEMGGGVTAAAARFVLAMAVCIVSKTLGKVVASAVLPAVVIPDAALREIVVRWVTYTFMIAAALDVTPSLVGMA
jgi:membrane-associated phospholipid phosphatase